MGLFDGIIGAETPVSNMGDSMTPQVGGTTGSSGGTTGDDGSTPVMGDQNNPPLIIPMDTNGDGESLIIHDAAETESPVVQNSMVDFDISMPEIITKETQTTDTTSGISLIDEVSSETQPVSDMIALGSVTEMPPVSLSDESNPATLEDRIAGFVADLERLKADDEMILHEKESAIEKLETEMKELTKEIKKIQADEKRIDATIASINTPVAKGK
jgi:hypothetical protein